MVSGGESSGYGLLTVRENLWMFAQFYGIPSSVANQRIDGSWISSGCKTAPTPSRRDLSTGLRQKMNIVRGFLTDPEVLFLDEPTLGLDVGASRMCAVRPRLGGRRPAAHASCLTTHYMAEADELCDRVAIINQGRVLACDTPAALKRDLQRECNLSTRSFAVEWLRDPVTGAVAGRQESASAAPGRGRDLELILEEELLLASGDQHA